VALALALATGCAARTDPNVVLPERRGRGTPTSRDLSAPRDRGDIEIALGVVTSAVAATLIVLGSFSARQASTLKSICRGDVSTAIEDPRCVDPTGFDPVVAATVSSALSFTFAVPIAVGGGFLLGKGVRMRRAWQREQTAGKLSLRPWTDPRGAGLGLALRF
jgi:hypothetical protein